MISMRHQIRIVEPGTFQHHLHEYPKVHQRIPHPVVQSLFQLTHQQLIDRYCQLNPMVLPGVMQKILKYQPSCYRWAGADLIPGTDREGKRHMILIENNSCPSGQKSMPLLNADMAQGGYRTLMEDSFKPFFLATNRIRKGALVVLYDKNLMETSGYAAVMADVFQEPVYLVPFMDEVSHAYIRYRRGRMEIKVEGSSWLPVKAAFRYVTSRPWNRIGVDTSTPIFNPVIACIAGGRNKLVAAKAYEEFNAKLHTTGLQICSPETICDVRKEDIPKWVKHFGGKAVIKEPYSNAGQGVYTIVNDVELKALMQKEFAYTRFIVQRLIGYPLWEGGKNSGSYYQTGTLPDGERNRYVFDLRMMVCATPQGFKPVCLYSRRATHPLQANLDPSIPSWNLLGTNLSYRAEDGEWMTDTRRLMLMDQQDFHRLGLSLDDLIDAYVQAILSTIAIDRMAKRLINAKGEFRHRLFAKLNDDQILIQEIMKDPHA